MKMLYFKRAALLIGCWLLIVPAQAQWGEIGLFGGGSFYLGDLNPYTPYKCTHAAGGVFLRQNLNRRMNMRYAFTYGNVSAADSNSNDPHRENRNLSFKSPLYEFAAIAEIHFVRFTPGRKGRNDYFATPYLFFGLGLTRIKPQAYMNNRWFELQPLGTEGQGSSLNNKKKYALNQLVVPLGIGFKGNLTERIIIGFEFGIRKTFTDYLDDVSGDYADPSLLSELNGPVAAALADRSLNGESYTSSGGNRGNPVSKDWYSFSGLTLSYIIRPADECKNFNKKREL
jgi:hypothetical protein